MYGQERSTDNHVEPVYCAYNGYCHCQSHCLPSKCGKQRYGWFYTFLQVFKSSGGAPKQPVAEWCNARYRGADNDVTSINTPVKFSSKKVVNMRWALQSVHVVASKAFTLSSTALGGSSWVQRFWKHGSLRREGWHRTLHYYYYAPWSAHPKSIIYGSRT